MKSKHYIILALSLILTTSITCLAQEKSTIQASDANIQYIGRIDFSDPARPLFAYPNVTIKAKFEGQSINLLLKQHDGSTYSDNYFVSLIDGTDYNKFKVTSGQETYEIANNLTDGTHTVEIIKVTETYCGACEFLGFELDANKSLLPPDPLPDLKFEFYGNSITCGFGNEGSVQPAADNSYKAYAAVASRELGAQCHTISYSGIGVVNGGAPFTMDAMSKKTLALTNSNLLPDDNNWDFSRYTPDVVVVALGTNDYYFGLSNGSLTSSAFITGYSNFITQIRTAHPEAHIVCTNSPMLPDGNFDNYIKSVVSTFESNDDDNISYFGYTYETCNGLYTHPSAAQGTKEGQALAVHIDNILKSSSIKEDKLSNNNIEISPNPSNDILKIKYKHKIKRIQITDFSGKIILKEDLNSINEKNIDISQLTKGSYILTVFSNENYAFSQKILKI